MSPTLLLTSDTPEVAEAPGPPSAIFARQLGLALGLISVELQKCDSLFALQQGHGYLSPST